MSRATFGQKIKAPPEVIKGAWWSMIIDSAISWGHEEYHLRLIASRDDQYPAGAVIGGIDEIDRDDLMNIRDAINRILEEH